jgi:glucokinase
MNLSDISNASTLATRLALVEQILTEGPTQANFAITTPKGSYTVALTAAEWALGLSQIKNEVTETLVGLGVNVTG